jgi:hypothetical protein
MNIKETVNLLSYMEGDIAEVIRLVNGQPSFSYIVYLVDEPSNDDLVDPRLHDWIFGSVDEFEEKFDDGNDYDFVAQSFETDFNKDKEIDPEEKEPKTIHWYKVKCSLFKQEFGVKKWDDLMEFMKHTIGFDYTITGQYTENYTGVEGYYENGTMYQL